MTTLAKQNTDTQVVACDGGPLQLRSDVFLLVQDGIGRLFDLERARFYGLDPIATQMLCAVLANGLSAATQELAAEFSVSKARIAGDATELLEKLRQLGLLAQSSKRSAFIRLTRQIIAATTERAFALARFLCRQLPRRRATSAFLKLAWLSLRMIGWKRSITLWCVPRRGTCTAVHDHVISEIDQVVRDAAAAQILLPAACKERAIVAAYLLRQSGLDAMLIVGIERHPFAAHAWVECDRRTVTDDAAHCEMYTPLANYR